MGLKTLVVQPRCWRFLRMSYDGRGEWEINTVVFVAVETKTFTELVIAGLKVMEMWMIIAAAGCGLLANCWNVVRLKSQVMEDEAAHVDCNNGVENDTDRLGERIKRQEIIRESHLGENPDVLSDFSVAEFGFGRRLESWKRGSSVFGGRARVFRAAISKPMSSLESCLISYEISGSCISCGKQRQRQRESPLLVTDGSKIRGAGVSPLFLPIPIIDCGLSCHNGINSGKPGAVPITGLPALRQCSQSSGNAGYRLVCFGVGIGVMSTMMSNKREMERLTCLVRQKEELVEDLEEQLGMRGSWAVKDVADEIRSCLETWQQTDDSFDALSNEVCEVERTSDKNHVKEMESMTSVEEELEAELEKLGFNLRSPNHQTKFLGINEIDPDFSADVVSGELREGGLICNPESEEDNNSSLHKEFNTENFAVSPRDLERRLHEVIISRLQDRITELETELEAGQAEVHAIKLALKQSNERNQTSQSLNSENSRWLQMPANRIYTISEMASNSSCTRTPPKVVCSEEKADQEIQDFETRFPEIKNYSTNAASPNALAADESFGKGPSVRKLNTPNPEKLGQIKIGLDFDRSVANSTLNVVRPYFDKRASTDCISPCHASVTYSEMDFADIPIIDAELDKFMSDFLMDFGLDSKDVGSVRTLLDHCDDLSELLTENRSCGNAIQTITEP